MQRYEQGAVNQQTNWSKAMIYLRQTDSPTSMALGPWQAFSTLGRLQAISNPWNCIIATQQLMFQFYMKYVCSDLQAVGSAYWESISCSTSCQFTC
jgi:hypothetical protein